MSGGTVTLNESSIDEDTAVGGPAAPDSPAAMAVPAKGVA